VIPSDHCFAFVGSEIVAWPLVVGLASVEHSAFVVDLRQSLKVEHDRDPLDC